MDGSKLIRDRILGIIDAKGERLPANRLCQNSDEHIDLLEDKLLEEVEEVLNTPRGHPMRVEELADVVEVCHAMARLQGKSVEDLEAVRMKKREERGGFDHGVIARFSPKPPPLLQVLLRRRSPGGTYLRAL